MSLIMWGDCMDEELSLDAQFDLLVEQKIALWDKIKDIPDAFERENTSEWEQIRKIDEQLLVLDAQIKGGR